MGGVGRTAGNLLVRGRKFTNHSHLTVDGNPLKWNDQWLASPAGLTRQPRAISNIDVVFGGVVIAAPAGRIDTKIGVELSSVKNGVAERNATPVNAAGRVLLT